MRFKLENRKWYFEGIVCVTGLIIADIIAIIQCVRLNDLLFIIAIVPVTLLIGLLSGAMLRNNIINKTLSEKYKLKII